MIGMICPLWLLKGNLYGVKTNWTAYFDRYAKSQRFCNHIEAIAKHYDFFIKIVFLGSFSPHNAIGTWELIFGNIQNGRISLGTPSNWRAALVCHHPSFFRWQWPHEPPADPAAAVSLGLYRRQVHQPHVGVPRMTYSCGVRLSFSLKKTNFVGVICLENRI